MKRVLFCLSDFKQGGIPRCLQSLLEQLDTSFVKADVLCLYQDGPYKGALKIAEFYRRITLFPV